MNRLFDWILAFAEMAKRYRLHTLFDWIPLSWEGQLYVRQAV